MERERTRRALPDKHIIFFYKQPIHFRQKPQILQKKAVSAQSGELKCETRYYYYPHSDKIV